MTWSLLIQVLIILILWIGIIIGGCYLLADINIFFTKVPQGEIVVAMYSDNVSRYIGNVVGYSVDMKTGEVKKKTEETEEKEEPWNIFGTGIYWLGLWPFANRYTYDLHRLKFDKERGSNDYSLTPKDDIADSIYHRASYGVVVNDAETSENLPLKITLVITTETTNANLALFGVKSPGWLPVLTAAVQAQTRNFVGGKKLEDINKKSILEEEIMRLDMSSFIGQKISAVSFLEYEITTEALSPIQESALEKFKATNKGLADLATKQAETLINKEDIETARNQAEAKRIRTEAEAQAITAIGTAEASATLALGGAVRDNPELVEALRSQAIGEFKASGTLIIGDKTPVITKTI